MDTREELDYEPEEEDMTKEVIEEAREPQVRKKRVRQGKGKKKKVQPEEERA